jgi:hypothetical protein
VGSVSVFFCLMVRFFVATRRHACGHVDAGISAPDVPHEKLFRREAFIQRIPQGSFLKRIFYALRRQWKIAHAVK